MAKFAVIIPAAGKSDRFGGTEKKTFAKIDGRPMFLRTVGLFLNRPEVCQTILAIAPEDAEAMKTQYGANLGFMGVTLVTGGDRRTDTVLSALKAVKDEAEYIAIHDAARPCTSAEQIDSVFGEAVKTAAAILAIPLTGTIKRVSGAGVVEATVSREGLYEAQTPQVFRRDVIVGAYERLGGKAAAFTDDAQLVEGAGHPVSVVNSDATNLKVTTRGDLTIAAAIIKTRPAKPVSRMGAFEEAQW